MKARLQGNYVVPQNDVKTMLWQIKIAVDLVESGHESFSYLYKVLDDYKAKIAEGIGDLSYSIAECVESLQKSFTELEIINNALMLKEANRNK